MTLPQLVWSEPATTGYKTISAQPDGNTTWRITPVPRDVVRISHSGYDTDGTFVTANSEIGYAESVEEAKILIDLMRAGSSDLPGWREQLEAAGFVRTYPDAADDDGLSTLWNDGRENGLFQICIRDGFVHSDGEVETSAHATYESGRASFWHNVCRVNDGARDPRSYGELRMRNGLPEGVDALRTGVAAAIAIRAARVARGGRFATPIGGAPRSR